MTVRDLNRNQLVELKQAMLCDMAEVDSPSYGELADADTIVPDEDVFAYYAGTEFSEDDFFCGKPDGKCGKNMRNCVSVTAQPSFNSPWIRYQTGNDGEKDYYRDYLDPHTGEVLYSYGEECLVYPLPKGTAGGKVLLGNEQDEAPFEIPLDQFEADFGPMSDVLLRALMDGPVAFILLDENVGWECSEELRAQMDDTLVKLCCPLAFESLEESSSWQFCRQIDLDVHILAFPAGYASFQATASMEQFRALLSAHSCCWVEHPRHKIRFIKFDNGGNQ